VPVNSPQPCELFRRSDRDQTQPALTKAPLLRWLANANNSFPRIPDTPISLRVLERYAPWARALPGWAQPSVTSLPSAAGRSRVRCRR